MAFVSAFASLAVSGVGSVVLGCGCVLAAGVLASVLVSSPFLVEEKTLSAFSFFTVTRERFFLSSLRSSFSLSAATF